MCGKSLGGVELDHQLAVWYMADSWDDWGNGGLLDTRKGAAEREQTIGDVPVQCFVKRRE